MPISHISARWLVPGTLLLALVSTGCAHRSQSPDPHPAQRAQAQNHTVYHTVLPGQTLWRISRAYATTVEALASTNALSNPSQLAAGTRLLIPGAVEAIVLPAPSDKLDTPNWTWPITGGKISSYFGASRRNHHHQGVDILGKRGDAVRAARAGHVTYSGSSMRGYGDTIIIDHGDGMSSLYAHNSKLMVRKGQRVDRGQTIALVGKTGNASTEHCHLEIRQNQVAVDPLQFISTAYEGERR
jgi:murein DD-endopeptidase MepM/ murein hydrolase activator NlpD